MNRTHIKQLGIGLLIFLAILSWIGYLSFIKGWVLGIYPLAVLYSGLLSPIVSLAVFLSFQWWVLLPGIVLCLSLFALYARRRWLRLAFFTLIVWPLLIVVLLPAMVGLSSGQRLVIEPWGQVYRTAYSSLWLDDNYGDVLLFKCDRSGTFCQQVHEHSSVVGAAEVIPMRYDAGRNLFRLGSEPVVYVRSREKQICSISNTNSYLLDREECSADDVKPDTLPPK